MAYIGFTSTDKPHGYLGNMYAAPVIHEGKKWLTTEALFQALRFDDPDIREKIRTAKSPMSAKFIAKANSKKMTVMPMSDLDVSNMRLCLKLKFTQHPELKEKLLRSGDHIIFEDVSKRRGARHRFWGAVMEDGNLEGTNMLGELLMELRNELRMKIPE